MEIEGLKANISVMGNSDATGEGGGEERSFEECSGGRGDGVSNKSIDSHEIVGEGGRLCLIRSKQIQYLKELPHL